MSKLSLFAWPTSWLIAGLAQTSVASSSQFKSFQPVLFSLKPLQGLSSRVFPSQPSLTHVSAWSLFPGKPTKTVFNKYLPKKWMKGLSHSSRPELKYCGKHLTFICIANISVCHLRPCKSDLTLKSFNRPQGRAWLTWWQYRCLVVVVILSLDQRRAEVTLGKPIFLTLGPLCWDLTMTPKLPS